MLPTRCNLAAEATCAERRGTRPDARHRGSACTNISCSLNGADELYERLHEAVGDDDPDINVRHFECLGACDIAPMASVDGVYVGPIALDEVPELVDDIRSGRPPLARKQLRLRAEADTLPMDPGARNQAAGMPHAATPDGALPPAPTSYGGEMDAPDRRAGDPKPDGGGTTQGHVSEGPTAPIEQAPGGPAQSDEREDPA
jgi:uncharacterized protein YuzB (UPF0349 family)